MTEDCVAIDCWRGVAGRNSEEREAAEESRRDNLLAKFWAYGRDSHGGIFSQRRLRTSETDWMGCVIVREFE